MKAAIITASTIASALMTAAPASAEATGTVAARTQRMSDATLTSRQSGWYEVGQRLTLVCSKRGQAVKGHFSFNIPNGGWDNLWYKTSDGSFVADVDIDTGTLSVVAPGCSPAPAPAAPAPQAAPASPPAPAPAPQGSREDRAIGWANGQIGSGAYPFLCGRFVANAYGAPGLGVDSALIFRNQLANAGQIHMDQNIPKGALVFSRSRFDKGNGHVVLARGNGTYISGGAEGYTKAAGGTGATVQSMNHWNPARGAEYLGWAYPPGNWQGR